MYLERDCPPPPPSGSVVQYLSPKCPLSSYVGPGATSSTTSPSPSRTERVALREALLAWSERADTNGFGDWEGYDGPYFSGAEAEMRPVAEWTFDGSHGDVDRAFDTMTGWLEHYNKSAAEPIRYLVVGFWDPEENLPPARLPQ
jgi:hypothetical protein